MRPLNDDERRLAKRSGILMSVGGGSMLLAGGSSIAWGSPDRMMWVVAAAGLGFMLSGLYRILVGVRGI